MELSLSSMQVTIIIWLLIGLLLGLLLSRLGPSRRRLSIAQAELGRHRAEIESRDVRIAALERDLAAARDQVRPLSDEVDRLRRDKARLTARAAPPSGPDMDREPVAPPPPPAAEMGEPLPPFLDAPRGQPDDLTMMKGVGGRFAAKLNDIGVFHLRQIADWTQEDAHIADSRLDNFRGRIERDQLIEQARLLAAGRITEYEARFGRLDRHDERGPM